MHNDPGGGAHGPHSSCSWRGTALWLRVAAGRTDVYGARPTDGSAAWCVAPPPAIALTVIAFAVSSPHSQQPPVAEVSSPRCGSGGSSSDHDDRCSGDVGRASLLVLLTSAEMLRVPRGREMRRGRERLRVPRGREWLRERLRVRGAGAICCARGARAQVAARAGRRREWLRVRRGREWLRVRRGREWLRVRGGHARPTCQQA